MGNGGTEPKQNCGGNRKTPLQIQSLESLYSEDKNPNPEAMEEYAAYLGLTYKQVRIWFSEKRRKEKKDGVSINSSVKKSVDDGKRSEGRSQDCSSSRGSPGEIKAKDIHAVQIDSRSRKSSRQLKAKTSAVVVDNLSQRKPETQLQVLLSPGYILTNVFRKDGPPLGVDFDTLPERAFDCHTGCRPHICLSKRTSQKRKVMESSRPVIQNKCSGGIPMKRYGIGKGLMTIWRSIHPDDECPISLTNEQKYQMSLSSFNSVERPTSRKCTNRQRQNLVLKEKACCNKPKEKQKPVVNKRKVSCSKENKKKDASLTECGLAFDDFNFRNQMDVGSTLLDDEELELSELQAGPNSLRCSAHCLSTGKNGCPLCKDMLGKFPPQFVKMKPPMYARPWIHSPGVVKKLFKVFRFLYSNAVRIDLCSFTFDELTQAFHLKDSLLLGKIHVALLKFLLTDVGREISSGSLSRTSKDCRYLSFLHSVKQQQLDVDSWANFLNPLTWIEILRQVLIMAGFGSKHCSARRESPNKEGNHLAKFGMHPHSFKGELFNILSEKGSRGCKVSELARASQIVSLSLPSTNAELEVLINSTLSSDITLFEKIGSSTFRLRTSITTKKEMDGSDSESGESTDYDSGDCSSRSTDGNCENFRGRNLDLSLPSIKHHKAHPRKRIEHLLPCGEIDESFSGEAWILGMMEGEYSDLSIEEKLDAMTALVELIGSGSNIRTEEPCSFSSAVTQNMRYYGSGAKIKKLLPYSNAQSRSSGCGHLIDGECATDNCRNCNTKPLTKSSCPHPLRSIHLGFDRRYNSYWLFLGPCNLSDPGHRRIYYESSEDGHWEVIDTQKDLCSLLSVLDCRGKREAGLLASLRNRETFLSHAMCEHLGSESGIMQAGTSDASDVDVSRYGSSPVSDVDNNTNSEETVEACVARPLMTVDPGKRCEETKLKWDQLQTFDKWIWDSFVCNLNVVKQCKKSYHESLTRCESCHDLYWRDEKHCKRCHVTLELDFDLEEKYAIHVATCRVLEGSFTCPNHKVFPSKLQALKAAVHTIEAAMPIESLAESWLKTSHQLWGKRLRRTSSLPELLQVVTDFVGAIKEEWLYENVCSMGSYKAHDDILILFQTMPQTTSAVALWMVKLDSIIAPYIDNLTLPDAVESTHRLKRKRACTLKTTAY